MLEGIHLKNIFTLEDRENLWELMEKEKGIKEIFHDKQDRVNSSVVSCLIKKEEETRAIFVSYIELNKYIKGNDYEISKRNIRKIIKNIKRLKCNTIILQVRSASDAIYKSNIYPMSLNIVNT